MSGKEALTDINTAKSKANAVPSAHTANYTFSKSFELHSDDTVLPGTLILAVPIDRTLDDAMQALANKHVRYQISELLLECESSSPMGTSSGSIQVCFIPDPQNLDFDAAGTTNNLNKAIRQSGSFSFKPRNQVTKDFTPSGKMFCATGVDNRLSSFGAIVFVQRDSPAAGDNITMRATIRGKAVFDTLTWNNNSSVAVTEQITLTPTAINKDGFTFTANRTLPTKEISIRTMQPLTVPVTKKINASLVTMNAKLTHFDGVMEGKIIKTDIASRLKRAGVIEHKLPIETVNVIASFRRPTEMTLN